MSARQTVADSSLSASETSMVSRADTNVSSREKDHTFWFSTGVDGRGIRGGGVTLQFPIAFATDAEASVAARHRSFCPSLMPEIRISI